MKRIKVYRIGNMGAGSEDIPGIFVKYCAADAEMSSEQFPDFRACLHSSSEALKCSEVIMYFVDAGQYCDAKKHFAAAFGMKMIIDSAELAKASVWVPETASDADLAVTHAGRMENSEALTEEDGLYGGFFCRSGHQSLWFLPSETDRTLLLLTEKVIPEISAELNSEMPVDFYEKYAAVTLEMVMADHDVSAAAAGTVTAVFFRNLMTLAPSLRQNIEVTPSAEESHGADQRDYACNLAVTASELTGRPYGISLTSVKKNSKKNTMSVAYAIVFEDGARIRTLSSPYGESVRSFLRRAAADAFLLLAQTIKDTDTDSGDDDDDADETELPRRPFIKKASVIICTVLIAAACLISYAMLALSTDGRIGSGSYWGIFDRPTEYVTTTYDYKETTTAVRATNENGTAVVYIGG